MTHQQRRQGTPAPNRTLTHSSDLNLALSIMRLILLTVFPFPAISAPVYASCRVECSNMANRMPAVHCSREWWELKWSRYRFLPAVDILKMFCNGCSSLDLVGKDSIILIEASVRLMNLGNTSPSSPAASSSAASHKERTVPTSCAKHSVHVRSGLGRPSVF